ncbi:hypothetical protein CC86DRAFT_366176 [Ophiobolus disseminans]|uniref:Uncharacterized protein n=1 Tax=Ophiobolus disseminans TaxID=1469910 RepID=A0A6A7AI46_9PLEO|nr:hypothetical protein CC86DRAFT_366176 [Ophiobolus disseminans]
MYLPPVLTQHQVETITTTIPAQIPRALGIGNTQVLDVYFLDGVEMQHVRVSGGGTTTGPASLDASILSGPMGVTAWQDVFARLYYPVDDGQKIMEAAAYEDGHWELSAMEGASYN